MISRISKVLAALSIATLAACGGGGGGAGSPLPVTPQQASTNPMFARIVGVGDSLTAGEQSDGLLGDTTVTNPLSILPGGIVQPGQENGWWALLYEQATGMSPAAMANPQTSVLPLIKGPGIGAQLIPTNPAVTGFVFYPSHLSCDAFNNSAYGPSGYGPVRLNPTATTYDVGVPGITAHEALYMVQSLTGPPGGPVGTAPNQYCPGYAPIATDPTAGALQALVSSESQDFYPVLGGFANTVSPLTEVNAAVSLKPTLTTVWLGANDLLHYIFSNGVPISSDTPTQMQQDITKIIQSLQKVGSKVVVANLPNVLTTPQFAGTATITLPSQQCLVVNYFACDLYNVFLQQGDSPAVAAGTAMALTAYVQGYNGGIIGTSGYVTESGYLNFLGQLAHGIQQPNLDDCNVLSGKTPQPGGGAGACYVTAALVPQVTALNAGYNAAIAAAAQATGAPLVDINTIFTGIASGNPSNPYFAAAASINPPKCCTLAFLGGLISFDGLHPSNTGYALIANAFIQTIDTAYPNANIPPFSAAQLTAIAQTDPYAQY